MDSLAKHYNETKKITGINLSISKGEIFALCGGNGAGKSTLIKMLTGMLKPTTGKILINGAEADPKSIEYKKLFSYMPDEMLFPRQLTGVEVLTFFARLRNISDENVAS